jgi:PPM family protein phosphatase
MGVAFVFAHAAASSRAASEDRTFLHARGDTVLLLGAGGMAGGGDASDAILDAVRTRAEDATRDSFDLRAWSNLFATTDAALAGGLTGETTAIVVVVGPDAFLGISVGDSEAWVVNGARVDRLTDTQDRKRLGSGRARPVAFHRRALDGVLVVATDGLFKHAARERITAACRHGDAPEIAQRLVELPRLPPGSYPDDVALVVVTASPSGAMP